MRGVVEEIRELGGELVIVGSGRVEQAADFRRELEIDGAGADIPLLSDPKLESYNAAELKRGVGATFSLRSMGHGLRAFREGHRQKGVQGDPWQQGGAFVIAPPGEVHFAFVSGEAGDHPEAADLVEVLRGVTSGSSAVPR